jgi:hypothetical protein
MKRSRVGALLIIPALTIAGCEGGTSTHSEHVDSSATSANINPQMQKLAGRIIRLYQLRRTQEQFGVSGIQTYEGKPPYTVGLLEQIGHGALSFDVQSSTAIPNSNHPEMIEITGFRSLHFRNMASLAISFFAVRNGKWNMYCTATDNQNSFTPQVAGSELRQTELYAGDEVVSHNPAAATAFLIAGLRTANELLTYAETGTVLPRFTTSVCSAAKD